MSLKLNEKYPGRFANPSAGYPLGAFKNRTTPTAKDGSYLEKDWANDKEGFFQSLIAAAGITPNGLVDQVGASQFYDALQVIIARASGVRINVITISASGTYTPTPGMMYASIEALGGGGAGGSAAGTAGQSAAGGGGGAGGYAKKVFTAAQIGASQPASIGSGGVSGAIGNNPGGDGGATSLGSLLIAPGGGGGGGAASSAQAGGSSSGGSGGIPTIGDTNTIGSLGGISLVFGSGTAALSGAGANSQYGRGAVAVSSISSGTNGAGYGSGGSGGAVFNSATNVGGGRGTSGLIVITEYLKI